MSALHAKESFKYMTIIPEKYGSSPTLCSCHKQNAKRMHAGVAFHSILAEVLQSIILINCATHQRCSLCLRDAELCGTACVACSACSKHAKKALMLGSKVASNPSLVSHFYAGKVSHTSNPKWGGT